MSVMAFVIDAGWYAIVATALTTQRAQHYYGDLRRVLIGWLVASGLMGFMGIKLILNP